MGYKTRTPTLVTGFPALAKAIVPHDSNPLTDYNGNRRAQTVYVGTAGDVVVVPIGNDFSDPVTFYVPTGGLVPVEVLYVKFTGTTATGLVGLF